jgi:drug/metabolite transporter (DMT)-like permease
MNPSPLSAALIALTGNFILSLGMVLQKRNVSWLGHKGARDRSFVRARSGWLLGFLLMNAAPIFNYLALLGLPPNVVGAAIGSSVAFTAILSALMLGETLGSRRLLWTCVMFAAIALAALRGRAGSGSLAVPALYAFLAVPLLGALVCVARRRRRKSASLAVAIAAVAGAMGGYMILPLRALQIDAGASLSGWLASPFLYLYIVAGAGSFSIVQLAYKDGEMSRVSPAYYGMQVLWPALASYFAFSTPFDSLQALAFAAIAACVFLIARDGAGKA